MSTCKPTRREADSPNKATTAERENWNHHTDFILSCVGYAVGYGSIWRFPYLCMRNGGGAFLLPYLFFMVTCGVPLFYLELAMGQFSSATPVSVWDVSPLFRGLGWTMLLVSGVVCLYYNIILTWVFYYLARSFTLSLPWRNCGNLWNSCHCVGDLSFNRTGNVTLQDLESLYGICGVSDNNTGPMTFTSPAEEFWENNTLVMSQGIDDLGPIQWHLVLCLAVAWGLIFACLCRGVKSAGKVVYVTATAPYLFLVILLIRNCTLDGAWNGIAFYLTPNWNTFKERKFSIWAEAASQVFFSLGPAWGGLITLSSFNKFNKNCYRDALLVPAVNCFTSLLGGFVIFSVVGFMAHKTGRGVEEVMKAGPGVIFVAYPEAIAQLPAAPLWSVLFFTMLVTIGVDSQFGMFETVASSLVDNFPALQRRKTAFVGGLSVLAFLVALPLTTRGGIYIFTLLDWYCGTFTLALVAFLEVVAVCYVYGISRFRDNIRTMIGYRPSHFWTAMWCVVTPTILLLIFCSSLAMYANPTYGKYQFPTWSVALGWTIGLSALVPIFGVAVAQMFLATEDTWRGRWIALTSPRGRWKGLFAVEMKEKMVEVQQEPELGLQLLKDEANHYLNHKP